MWDSWQKPNYSVDTLQVSTSLKALQHTSHLIQASHDAPKHFSDHTENCAHSNDIHKWI